MEEPLDDRCNVVYFCAGVHDDISELFHTRTTPAVASHNIRDDPVRHRTYDNVEILLDENQGGFHQVYVSSSAQQCSERLESYANTLPTVVLVEVLDIIGQDAMPAARTNPLDYLQTLSNDVQGARYQHHVMPFALLKSHPPSDTRNDEITTKSLAAGAIDVFHSPLEHGDVNRLVGHVRETTRPPARLLGASMAQNLVHSIRNTSTPNPARRRPDETLAPERRLAVEDAVGSWNFPAQDFSMDELTHGACHMLEQMLTLSELENYRVSRSRLMTFLLATRRQYKHEQEVHYHNWRHAVDVTQSLYCFLMEIGLGPPSRHISVKKPNAVEALLRPLDALTLLISAIGHDVGHPGVNNAFLVACDHPLAQMYNDKSVLENYHCAAYSQLLRRHWPSIRGLDGFRARMISTILATDMQRHFEYMNNMENLKQRFQQSQVDLSDWPDKDRDQNRELVMALLIKAADISNVARPFDISSRWARILMGEFSRQGELESELDIPTCLFGGPPDKDDILAAAESQKGFMNLFGFPLFSGMTEIMPGINCAIRELTRNREIWDQKIAEEKRRRDSAGDGTHLTLGSVGQEDVAEAKKKAHNSEPMIVLEEVGQPPSSPTPRVLVVSSDADTAGHPASQQRQYLSSGIAPTDEKRSSAPLLPVTQAPTGASRRSSKDVALDQLQQLTLFAHQSLNKPESRRGSADASWQFQQSYPNSRRGSKDESLTTILFTQGHVGQPSGGGSTSPPKTTRPPSSPGKPNILRQSLPYSQKQTIVRNSIPSARSHTTSSATATSQYSPSTQPSSYGAGETLSDPTPSLSNTSQGQSVCTSDEPLTTPGTWDPEFDRTSRDNLSLSLPSTPPLTNQLTRDDSPRLLARIASGESDGTRRSAFSRTGNGPRESRSRSRLRSLKFWKKKKETDGTESPSPTP
ncbi:Hypothetical protein R9X50_00078400 [Acrodontium crateriforme]|uniref:Phosphodiesterase n=1 Tax=Acrodontium crateriforme TaxID=150365 RepID=A0AAQ3LXW6_9PEZI|nr:Hypothetical protein R9X50_00078400 [Acrodontium crateriforme]